MSVPAVKDVSLRVLKELNIIPSTAIDVKPVFHQSSYHGDSVVQQIAQYWDESSSYSNDHRSSRYFHTMTKKMMITSTNHAARLILKGFFKSTDLSIGKTKKGTEVFRHPRKVYNKPTSDLYQDFKSDRSLPGGREVSLQFFTNCCPFYVTKATCREIQYCVCGLCDNVHNAYAALKKMTDGDLPEHLREFLPRLVCQDLSHEGWHSWSCVLRKCPDCKDSLAIAMMKVWQLLPAEMTHTPPFLRFGKWMNELMPERYACRIDPQEIFQFMEFFESRLRKYVMHVNLL